MFRALKTYPAAHESEVWGGYSVLVNGKEVCVYKARVSAMPFNQGWPGYQRPLDQTEIASFAYWDMDGTAEVQVVPSRPVKDVVIRPIARKIVPTVDKSRIAFTLPGPGHCSVEVNGAHHALALFGNPLEESAPALGRGKVLDASTYTFKPMPRRGTVPDPKDFDVLFFPPGIHEAGRIIVRSGQTVYISGGAVVYGVIEARHAAGIRILGRGILDGSRFARVNTFGLIGPIQPFGTILLYDCEDVEISGIVVRDPNVYGITPVACRRVSIADVKLIGLWRYNSDGIDLLNCEDVIIERCFVRSFDDSIVIKGVPDLSDHGEYRTGNRPCRNITVRDCVVWNDWGRALETGAETYASEISNVTYQNCDIIHATHVALDIQNGDHAVVRDFRYEDIRVELDDHAQTPQFQKNLADTYRDAGNGAYCPRLFVAEVTKTMWSMSERRGLISRVYLKNVRALGKKVPESYIVGHDTEHPVEDVTFQNFRVGAVGPAADASEAHVAVRAHVRNVVFKP